MFALYGVGGASERAPACGPAFVFRGLRGETRCLGLKVGGALHVPGRAFACLVGVDGRGRGPGRLEWWLDEGIEVGHGIRRNA